LRIHRWIGIWYVWIVRRISPPTSIPPRPRPHHILFTLLNRVCKASEASRDIHRIPNTNIVDKPTTILEAMEDYKKELEEEKASIEQEISDVEARIRELKMRLEKGAKQP